MFESDICFITLRLPRGATSSAYCTDADVARDNANLQDRPDASSTLRTEKSTGTCWGQSTIQLIWWWQKLGSAIIQLIVPLQRWVATNERYPSIFCAVLLLSCPKVACFLISRQICKQANMNISMLEITSKETARCKRAWHVLQRALHSNSC